MPIVTLPGLWHSSAREEEGQASSQTYNPPIRGAAMISSNDFRTGSSIELDGQVWRVVEFLHVKPGKGSAFVRTKLKSVQSGNVVERTFRAGETIPQAILEKATLQHTYMEGDDYVFMDMATYEETRLTADDIGSQRKYLKEGMEVTVVTHNNKPLEVELPNSVVLVVTQTDPGVKGDTATGGTKPAILETGAQVMVPLFISIGDKIKVDTRSDSYLGRES
jgi:elongation factor P